jgi:hypothetical protein
MIGRGQGENCCGGKCVRIKSKNSSKCAGFDQGKDGFCSSITKGDKGTAPRRELFASELRLHEDKSQPQVTLVGSSSAENAFAVRKLKSQKNGIWTTIICFSFILQEQRSQNRKLYWFLVSKKKLVLGIIIVT